MKYKLKLTALFILAGFATFAQTTIHIPEGVNLPGDTTSQRQLVSALSAFWNMKDSADANNPYVDKTHFLETSALLDEIRGIEASDRYKDEHFYKPYLLNAAALAPGTFFIQLAVSGSTGAQPLTRAVFELRARKEGGGYLFYSPLQDNTKAWKTVTSGAFIFHYKTTFPKKAIADYVRDASSFDKKLGAVNGQTEIFIADNFPEVLKLTGVQYKSDYNGYAFNTLSAKEAGKNLLIMGVDSFSHFDPHDLWHERLHNVYPATVTNKPVDEGCAYLYGGSWGMSWTSILTLFKQKVAKPGADYLSLYERFYNFGESDDKHLIAGYVMNALIVKKLEHDKGFGAVKELLTCGKYEKTNANYFAALERLTGITRANFNQRIAELIAAS